MANANEVTSDLYRSFFGEETHEPISLYDLIFTEADANHNGIPDKIEPYVKKLEAKGYKVKYSSPGYSNTRFDNDRDKNGVINSKLVTTGRIIFNRNYHFDNTPQGWEWKVLSNSSKALYVKKFTYNEKYGTEKEAFKQWQDSYLSNLGTWIDNLPKMGDEWKGIDGAEDKNFSAS